MTRDEKGRFVKGHPGIGGRPRKEIEREYLDILASEVPPATFRAIVKKAADQAQRGDAVARKWISDYLIGTPVQRSEIANADNEQFAVKVVVEYADDTAAPA